MKLRSASLQVILGCALLILQTGCMTHALLEPPSSITYYPEEVKQVSYANETAQIVYSARASDSSVEPGYLIYKQPLVIPMRPKIGGDAWSFSAASCSIDDLECSKKAIFKNTPEHRLTEEEKAERPCRADEAFCIDSSPHVPPTVMRSLHLPDSFAEQIATISKTNCTLEAFCKDGKVSPLSSILQMPCAFPGVWLPDSSLLIVRESNDVRCTKPFWLGVPILSVTEVKHRSLGSKFGRIIALPFAVVGDVVLLPFEFIIALSLRNMHLF